MSRRGWGTRYGFYLAAVGSAFGLGNLWRFPFVTGTNGGGAFVVLYGLCAIFIGLPILIAELILGRVTRKSVVAAMGQVGGGGKLWVVWGYLTIFSGVVVLSYYAVVSGWVLHFLGKFGVSIFMSTAAVGPQTLDLLLEKGWLQLLLTSVHLLLTILIVAKGVREGIEKWLGYIMPGFFILIVFLLSQALLLPSAGDALRFLFYPDFSKLTSSSLGHALGHVLFTLSLGFGMMVVFGSYMQDDVHLPTAGFRVTMVDLAVSLVAGFLIFAIAFFGGNNPGIGPQLLFQTVPILFEQVGGPWLGLAFFLCLYAASLGASMGLLEASVSNLMDRYRIKRSQASWMMGSVVFILAILPAMKGMSFLVIYDSALINWVLPLMALGVSLLVGFGMTNSTRKEVFVDATAHSSLLLYPKWLFVIRWLVPAAVLGAFLFQLVAWLV